MRTSLPATAEPADHVADLVATDPVLLQRHAHGQDRGGQAFAELVRRHINLVYSAALRQVRCPHQAQDVTQAVFLVLHQKAGSLGHLSTLSGWLLNVTRYGAVDAMRKYERRRLHERAVALARTPPPPPPDIALGEQRATMDSVLDEALAKLSPRDRDAVAMRYLQDQPFERIGQTLGTSADAARKRVSRAVEQLRGLMKGRGVEIPSAALVAGLTTLAGAAGAPASLASTVSGAIMVGQVTGSAASIAKGVLTMMTWMKVKLVMMAALLVVAAGGMGTGVVTQLRAQDPSAPSPAPAAAAPKTDGQDQPGIALNEVVERVITEVGEEMLLDVETGRLLDEPEGVRRNKEAQKAIFRELGADIGVSSNTLGDALVGIDMAVYPVMDEIWDEAKPLPNDSLRAYLNHLTEFEVAFPCLMSATAPLPKTYLFKTREGALGILQVIEVQKEIAPYQIRVRYKLLERAET